MFTDTPTTDMRDQYKMKSYELTHPTNKNWTKIRFDVYSDRIMASDGYEVEIFTLSPHSPTAHSYAKRTLDQARDLWILFVKGGWKPSPSPCNPSNP